MSKTPSSFCTICTKTCKQELIGFLLSLSLHHPDAPCFVICDSFTQKYILETCTPKIKLNITWDASLDKYSNLNRDQMVKRKIWDDFQMAKADAIALALKSYPDVLFLDSDTIILDTLEVQDGFDLGVSPQFIQKKNVNETGYYNGGMLWTNQSSLPDNWKKYTKTSRYHDQASIEDLVKIYTYFEFGDHYNLQTWRFILGVEPTNKITLYIQAKPALQKVYYKDKPLKFIHTHFNSARFQKINNLFIQKLNEAHCYRELLIIFRVIHDKWVLTIPKQPAGGIWNHANDSFREMAWLWSECSSNSDLVVREEAGHGHCALKPNILLYDRPTMLWYSKQAIGTSLFLLGNGSMNVEGKQLRAMGVPNVKPWIFWARNPRMLEKFLIDSPWLDYKERSTGSIFIGNYENNIQEKYRKGGNWKSVIDEFHCIAGHKKKFAPLDYLKKLSQSRYGLCLRGYGSKCHREVELMALGTIPIVTSEVSITSYQNPPIEGTHFLRVAKPEELKPLLDSITEEQWTTMSKACIEWFLTNIHSEKGWKTMLNKILYE